jgi:16S rRNA (uracil1498-N3)-methyltransferase
MQVKAAGNKERHEFALFVEALSLLVQHKKAGDYLLVSNETLVHRMINVLRLRLNDQCVLFDRNVQVFVVITEFIGKKQIQVKLQSIKNTLLLSPSLTFLLPVLKRDDYEAALYALTEVGVNRIQLVFTHKTSHQWSGNKDLERAQRIIIGAAEQSKNFAYPELKAPIMLEVALQQYRASSAKVFFDPEGMPFFEVMQQLHTNKSEDVLLLVGPEGDLHSEEKKIVQNEGFIFCSLTPTIMRAVQAATLGAGFVRSLLSNHQRNVFK